MTQPTLFLDSGADFSANKMHRYALWRVWDADKPAIMFIGLNPSRADEVKNDNTISKCIKFAQDFGYGRMYFLNLYSFRTPYVKRDKNFLKHLQTDGEKFEPLVENLDIAVGPAYLQYFIRYATISEKIVCCWGSWPFIEWQQLNVMLYISKLEKTPWCFGVNNNGSPKHPLYLKGTTKLMKYDNFHHS